MRPFDLQYDPQSSGPQYLEDLATGYWFSRALFTAVEAGIFDLLSDGGKTAAELADRLTWNAQAAERLLEAQVAMGLLTRDGDRFYHTRLSSDCLVQGKAHYQGDSILWRRDLMSSWGCLPQCLQAGGRVSYPRDDDPEGMADRIRRYIRAMDNVARSKIEQILPLFGDCDDLFNGASIIDIGAGSGAMAAGFLERFPHSRATLVDLPQVLEVAGEILQERGLGQRMSFCKANILERWPLPERGYDLVILSNIIHAYSQPEIGRVLEQAAACLNPGGYLLIHDFFPEHQAAKAALLDLNMLANTYNGMVFPAAWVERQLAGRQLVTTGLISLPSDTAVLVAAREPAALAALSLDAGTRLISRVRALGFAGVYPMAPSEVRVVDWAGLRCQFGCSHYGQRHCPPHSPTPEKTRKVLREFKSALLLKGEPPAGDFQKMVLQAEQLAFKDGYYKAFALWAGPCALCPDCAQDSGGQCRHPERGRPSMEGAGIDVFATVRELGLRLRTLQEQGEFVCYFAMLLLE